MYKTRKSQIEQFLIDWTINMLLILDGFWTKLIPYYQYITSGNHTPGTYYLHGNSPPKI